MERDPRFQMKVTIKCPGDAGQEFKHIVDDVERKFTVPADKKKGDMVEFEFYDDVKAAYWKSETMRIQKKLAGKKKSNEAAVAAALDAGFVPDPSGKQQIEYFFGPISQAACCASPCAFLCFMAIGGVGCDARMEDLFIPIEEAEKVKAQMGAMSHLGGMSVSA
jgi:hypothetical protein